MPPVRVSGNVKRPLEWSLNAFGQVATSPPAAVAKAASPGIVHVCTAILLTCSAQASSSYAGWNLYDGPNVLMGGYLEAQPGGGRVIPLSGLNIPGTAGNYLLLQIGAWTGPIPYNSVVLTGYDL